MKLDKKWLWVVAIFVFISALTPYIIDCLTNKFPNSLSFTKAELLTFWGSFLAFVGTVALGALALWQNYKFKEEADKKDEKIIDMENEKIRLQYLPQFLIQSAIIDKFVDNIYTLPDNLRDTHIILDKFKSYIFFYDEGKAEWVPNHMFPAIEKGKENLFFSIYNCGNNSAHQVKLSILLNGVKYNCDKAMSILKDDEICFYFSINKKLQLPKDAVLNIRYFDNFQNIYEQKFEIAEDDGTIYFISYAETELVKRNESMNIATIKEKN